MSADVDEGTGGERMRKRAVLFAMAALPVLMALPATLACAACSENAGLEPSGGQEGAATRAASSALASAIGTSDDQERFGFSYWIELIESPGAAPVRVDARRVFKSGERIRLHVQATSPGVVTLIQIGDSGTSSILFPG